MDTFSALQRALRKFEELGVRGYNISRIAAVVSSGENQQTLAFRIHLFDQPHYLRFTLFPMHEAQFDKDVFYYDCDATEDGIHSAVTEIVSEFFPESE